MMGRRSLSCFLLSVSVVTILAGCDIGVAWEPLSVSRDGSKLLVAVCADTTVVGINGFIYKAGHGNDAQQFWAATGSVDVQWGQTISPDLTLSGMNPQRESSPALAPGTVVELVLNLGPDDPHGSATGTFTVPDSGLPEQGWLHPDGAVTDEPCVTQK